MESGNEARANTEEKHFSSLLYYVPFLQSTLREHVQSLEEEGSQLKGRLEQAPSATRFTKMQKQISELAVTPRHLLLLASRTPYVRIVLECTAVHQDAETDQ